MTDIATGWTVNRSVKDKVARWVVEANDVASRQFPFPIVGIDSDNGAEFINAHLFEYCLTRKITFTKSRSGNKNDGRTWSRRTEPTAAGLWATYVLTPKQSSNS